MEITRENNSDYSQPTLLHAEPVLSVSNIVETVNYWHDVLGFPDKWTWGDPPNHGGVSWRGGAFIQFSLNPKLAAVSAGHSVWIRVRNLEALYAMHRERQAKIVDELQNRPWGMADYAVQDINGYNIYFSAPAIQTNSKPEKPADEIRIVHRAPTIVEHQRLCASVGWATANNTTEAEALLKSIPFAVVAELLQTREVVGCALLPGDGAAFYYVKDVMVHPHWQHRGIGTAMMHVLIGWLETHAPASATVGLFTGDHLAPFYRQFGFIQACGMYRSVRKS